jgi:hypothetical protein
MIQKHFKLELDFRIKIKNSKNNNSKIIEGIHRYDRLINDFVNAFVEHGDALKGYFTQDLIQVWVTDEDQYLLQLLGEKFDDRYFLEVAEHCSDEIKQFIYDIFDDSRPPTVQRSDQEKEELINKIYKKLGHLRIVNAQFTVISPEKGKVQKKNASGNHPGT